MEKIVEIEEKDPVKRFDEDLKVLKDFFVGNSDGLRETVFKVSNENKLDMAKIIYSSDDKYKISNVDHDFCDPIRTFFTQQFPNIKSKKLQFENQLVNINNQLSQLSWWQFIKRFRLNKQKKRTLNDITAYRIDYKNRFQYLNDITVQMNIYPKTKIISQKICYNNHSKTKLIKQITIQ